MKDKGGWVIGNRKISKCDSTGIYSWPHTQFIANIHENVLKPLRVKALVHNLDYEMHPNILKEINVIRPLTQTHCEPSGSGGWTLIVCGLFWQLFSKLSVMNQWWGQMVRALWIAVPPNESEMDPFSMVSPHWLHTSLVSYFNKKKGWQRQSKEG